QMNPAKMRAGRVGSQPLLGMCSDVHTPPFHASPMDSRRHFFREVVIKIEAAIESGGERMTIEDHCANESSGAIAVALKQFCPGRMRGCQRHGEVRDSMRAWKQAGQNGRM